MIDSRRTMTWQRRGCCGPFGGGAAFLPAFWGPGWGGGWGGPGWGGPGWGGWGGGPNIARASVTYPQQNYGNMPMSGYGPQIHYHHDRHRHFY